MNSAVYAAVRCLSVCLSVTLVYCIETTELIVKQLALDCSRGRLVLMDTKHGTNIFRDPLIEKNRQTDRQTEIQT